MECILHTVVRKSLIRLCLSRDLRQEAWYPGNRVPGKCKGTEASICVVCRAQQRAPPSTAGGEEKKVVSQAMARTSDFTLKQEDTGAL